MRAAVMRWRSSWRREDVVFSLFLLVIAAVVLGLAAIAIEAFGWF